MGEIIKLLLGFVTKPWKGVWVALFTILCSVLVFLYMERGVIDQLVRERYVEPHIDYEMTEQVAEDLLGFSDLVVVYEVDLQDNTQRAIKVVPSDDGRPPLLGLVVPFIPTGPSVQVVITEITGAIVCWNINAVAREEASPHVRWYQDHGYSYACARKIPGEPGRVLGLVHLVWKEKPDRPIEYSARVAIGSRLEEMVAW